MDKSDWNALQERLAAMGPDEAADEYVRMTLRGRRVNLEVRDFAMDRWKECQVGSGCAEVVFRQMHRLVALAISNTRDQT